MGPAAGGAVYSPALTDFIFMTAATSYMFVTGPNVVKQVLNETISPEELGGASVHAVKSGVADFVFNDDENTLRGVKMLLSYLPSNNIENAPYLATDDPADRIEESLRDLVPEDPDKPYDVRNIIRLITDKGKFLEIAENYAPNIIIGLARFGGYVTGIVANQPQVMAGTLDMNSSVKAAVSSISVIVSIFPSLLLKTFPDSCRELIRNMPGLSAMEQNYCMLTPGLLYPKSPSYCENLTEEPISL